jgi:hypothetical protein
MVNLLLVIMVNRPTQLYRERGGGGGGGRERERERERERTHIYYNPVYCMYKIHTLQLLCDLFIGKSVI